MSEHPSNRLYRGECTDIEDAIETYQAALEHEAEYLDSGETPSPAFVRARQAASRCLVEYRNAVQSAEQALIQSWLESKDSTTRIIGQAAQSGDFSVLAI